MPGFVLSEDAANDLEDIRWFLMSVNPSAAEKYRGLFLEAFRRLSQYPSSGRARPSLFQPRVRTWSVRPYVIVYNADVRPIEIVRVLHGSRDLDALLGESV